MTITPEHHEDGTHVGAPTAPTPAPTSLRPGDEHDWQPGETEADREARLQQLGYSPTGELLNTERAEQVEQRDLRAEWAEQQAAEDGTQRDA
jgi:hypothetical protein